MITNLEKVIGREFKEKFIEGKLEVAKQMLLEGLSLSLIQKITNLGPAE